MNRIHFLLGILSYLASPLWLAFLILSCVIAWRGGAETNGWPTYPQVQAVGLFAVTLVLLFLPKVLSLYDLQRRGEADRFGGWDNVINSVLSETAIFTLIAPILMLFHTKFVVLTLCRQSVSWGTQRRGGAGAAAWREAASAHFGHTVFGVLLLWVATRISTSLAWWMSPLIAGTMLSIPISYLTGDTHLGLSLKRRGFFVTPEESDPSPELQELAKGLAEPPAGRAIPDELHAYRGIVQAVLDPYVNAAHVSLLRAKNDPPPATAIRLAELRERLVREGPERLSKPELAALLGDVDSMVELHEGVWAAPAQTLAPWWRDALSYYQIVSASPQTAFTPAV